MTLRFSLASSPRRRLAQERQGCGAFIDPPPHSRIYPERSTHFTAGSSCTKVALQHDERNIGLWFCHRRHEPSIGQTLEVFPDRRWRLAETIGEEFVRNTGVQLAANAIEGLLIRF